MPDNSKSYMVNGDLVDIPNDKADAFKQKYPAAKEVNVYVNGQDTVGIPLEHSEAFLKKFPNATPVKKKESSNPFDAIWGSQENTAQKPSGSSQTSLKEITPNLSTNTNWFNGVQNVPDDKSPMQVAQSDAEAQKKVATYSAHYHDAVSMGDTPLANPDQMLTGKEKQKLQEKDAYTYMRHDFLGNPKYLSPIEREQYYNHIKDLLPKADLDKIKQQGEYYAFEQSAYNVARTEMIKNPTADNLYTVGDYQAQNGDTKTALKTFGKIVQDHPENPKGYKGLAYVSFLHHDVQGALKFIDQGLTASAKGEVGNIQSPVVQNPELLADKSFYLWQTGKQTDAVSAINAAVKSAPPGSKELANALKLRANMRNVSGNVAGAAEDNEKALQAYDTYNARFGYYYQGGMGTPVEEKKKVHTMRDGVIDEGKEVTVELTPEQKQAEDKKAELEKKFTDISNEPKEGFWDTGFPWSKNYYTQEERKKMVTDQLMSPYIQQQQEAERQKYASQSQNLGILDAYWLNPREFINEHLDNTAKQVIEGVKNMGEGATSVYNNISEYMAKSQDLPLSYYLMQQKKAVNHIINGALKTVGGAAGFTPAGAAINLGFEEVMKQAPATSYILQGGTHLYESGHVDKDTGEEIDNAIGLGAMLLLHKAFKGGPPKGPTEFTPFQPPPVFEKLQQPTDFTTETPITKPPTGGGGGGTVAAVKFNDESLQNFSKSDILSAQNKALVLNRIFANKPLTDGDLLNVQKDFKNIKSPQQFADVLKGTNPVLVQMQDKFNEYLEQQKKFAEANKPKAETPKAPVEQQQAPIVSNEKPVETKTNLKGEDYVKQGNKWIDSKGEEVVNAKKLADLNKQEKTKPKAADKPVDIDPKVEEYKNVLSQMTDENKVGTDGWRVNGTYYSQYMKGQMENYVNGERKDVNNNVTSAKVVPPPPTISSNIVDNPDGSFEVKPIPFGDAEMARKEGKVDVLPPKPTVLPPMKVGNAAVNPEGKKGPVVMGKATSISMPDGSKRDAHFAVVELDNFLASHNENNYSDTEGYPLHNAKNINDRNYKTDKTNQLEVDNIANKFDPSLLINNSPSPAVGTAIGSEDLVATSGNNRTMSAKKTSPANIAAYKKELIAEASVYGIDPTAIEGMNKPYLIRIDHAFQDYTTAEMAKYNQKVGKGEDATDKAIRMGKQMNDPANAKFIDLIVTELGKYDTLSEAYSNKGTRDLIREAWINSGLIAEREMSEYFDKNGLMTDAGKALLKDSMFGVVLSEDALRGAKQEGAKVFGNTLESVIPALIKNKSLGEYSLIDNINAAVLLQNDYAAYKASAEAKGKNAPTMESYLKQGALFDKPTQGVVEMHYLIDSGAKKLKEFLQAYNDNAGANDLAGGGMFDEVEKYTPEELYDKLKNLKLDENDKKFINKVYTDDVLDVPKPEERPSSPDRGKNEPKPKGQGGKERPSDGGLPVSGTGSGAEQRPSNGNADKGINPVPNDVKGQRPPMVSVNHENIPAPTHSTGETYDLDKDQIYGVNVALSALTNPKNRGFLLADGAGTGKTRLQLVAAKEMAEKTGKPSLILTQNQKIIDGAFKKVAAKWGLDLKNANIELGTYNQMTDGKIGNKDYGLIVYDEAHNLKNADSKRSIAAANLKGDKHLFATATPMDTVTGAAYFISEVTGWTEPQVLNKLGLKITFTTNPDTGQITKTIGFDKDQNVDTYKKNIYKLRDEIIAKGLMLRREFPFWGKIGEIHIPLTTEEADEQRSIMDHWDAKIEDAPYKMRMNLAGQRSGELRRHNETTKFKVAVREVENDIKAGKKPVVMADRIEDTHIKGLDKSHPGIIKMLTDYFEKKGYKVAKIYGGGDNTDQVEMFQNGTADLAIATPESGSTGIDLDDQVGNAPRVLHMITAPYSGNVLDQALFRISRKFTKSEAEVKMYWNDSSSDSRTKQISDAKMATLRAIQNGKIDDISSADLEENQPQVNGEAPAIKSLSTKEFKIVNGGKIYHQLKAAGGEWRKREKAIVFPNSRMGEVQELLKNLQNPPQHFERQQPIDAINDLLSGRSGKLPDPITQGKEVERTISHDQTAKGHYVWITDPTKVQGQYTWKYGKYQPNHANFLWDKVPDSRPMLKYNQAPEPSPEGLGHSNIVHQGAPMINARQEVVQGSTRHYSIQNLSPDQKATYNKDISGQSAETGITPETIKKNPQGALYWMADVNDAKAGELSGKTELDMFPKDWDDVVNDNLASIGNAKLQQLGKILIREGYDNGLIKHGGDFVKALVDAGMLKPEQEGIFLDNAGGLNSVGLKSMDKMVRTVLAWGLHGELKQPFFEDFDKMPNPVKNGVMGNGFRMMAMGENSPMPLVQRAMLLMNLPEGVNVLDADANDHELAMVELLQGIARPSDFTKFIDKFEDYLHGDTKNGRPKQSLPEALNNALSTDAPVEGVDEALKPITYGEEEGKGTDEAAGQAKPDEGNGEGKQDAKAPVQAPAPPNIDDFTPPIEIEPKDKGDNIDVTKNAGFGMHFFDALLHLRSDFSKSWLNGARYVIEGASRARKGALSAEESGLNKLREVMQKQYPVTPDEAAEVDKFIDVAHQADGIKRIIARKAKQKLPPMTQPEAPANWTDNQKEHYRVISDLQNKMTKLAINTLGMGSTTLTPEWAQRIQDTPSYLPRTPLKQSKLYKDLEVLKAAARKALLQKDMPWEQRLKEQSRDLLHKIGQWGATELQSLIKNGLTTKDLQSMLTTQRYHRALGPDGNSFVVKFTRNGIIEKWDNKEKTDIGTYKGKTGGAHGDFTAPKNAIWAAKNPESGTPDHYIFDNKPIQIGEDKDDNPIYMGKRNVIRKAAKTSDFMEKSNLLRRAGLPIDFFDKFEPRKNPNGDIQSVVNKNTSFMGADGKKYQVLPETKENIEANTNEEYEKNPLWAAMRAYDSMLKLHENTKYFHDIMNSPSMRDLVFNPSIKQKGVIEANKIENVKSNLGVKDFTNDENRAYQKAKAAAYEAANIPADFDENWDTPRKIDGNNTVMPKLYLDTYFKKGDYKMLKGDMTRKPQDPQRAVQSLISIWFMTKMNPLMHLWNIAGNVMTEGADPLLLGRAKNSFLNQDEFYKQYKKAGGFTVGDVSPGMRDVQKGFVDDIAKNDPELNNLLDELKSKGLGAIVEKIGKGGAKAFKWARNKENALLWHTQNIALMNEAMTRMQRFGYELPSDLNDIDWTDPNANIALQKSIEDMQRTVDTYFIGDKAYGLNNGMGQMLARVSRTKMLTLFAPYRQGNLRVLRNRINDAVGGIPAGVREGGSNERPGDEEKIRRAISAYRWSDAILASLALGYLINQWANAKDKDKTDEWYYPGIVGMAKKGIDAIHTTLSSESTHADASDARGKFFDVIISLSPPTVELNDIYQNRNSFNGKPIFQKDASAIDNGQKLFSYLFSGGNIYTAVNYMSEGNITGMERGLATLFTPQRFKNFTPSEQLYVNNIWEWHNTYKDELRKANEVLDSDTTTDASVVRLSQQYVTLLQRSSGQTSEFLMKEIPKIQQELIDKKMLGITVAKGMKSPMTGAIQKSDSTERDDGTTDDGAALKFWADKLEIAKQTKLESDTLFQDLIKASKITGKDDTLNLRESMQEEIDRQLDLSDSLMHDAMYYK